MKAENQRLFEVFQSIAKTAAETSPVHSMSYFGLFNKALVQKNNAWDFAGLNTAYSMVFCYLAMQSGSEEDFSDSINTVEEDEESLFILDRMRKNVSDLESIQQEMAAIPLDELTMRIAGHDSRTPSGLAEKIQEQAPASGSPRLQ